MNTERCLICRPNHKTLYFHVDPQDGAMWCYCNKCARGYSIYEYTAKAGISLKEFLKNDIDLEEAQLTEVRKMEWPAWFIPFFDRRAAPGLEYLKGRGLEKSVNNFYYDLDTNGIVIPYYFGPTFVGAQIRFVEPQVDVDGELHKVDTLPGTRLGLIFYNYNQQQPLDNIKAIVVCEGAFNSQSLQQALDALYPKNNPFRCIATSGCSITDHHADVLKGLKEQGKKIILAFDADKAGVKGIKKALAKECVTHVALTGETEIDWNDILQTLDEVTLAKLFMGSIRGV